MSARVEALRELLAGEELDGALELPLEARGSLFPGLAEPLVERDCIAICVCRSTSRSVTRASRSA